jgi:hypothetical protein
MKPKAAQSNVRLTTSQLVADLKEAMESQDYSEVDNLLSTHSKLVHYRNDRCEEPLIIAIRLWDPKLVNICVKHGANPENVHQCSKDKRPKNAFLVATEDMLIPKLKGLASSEKQYSVVFDTYKAILAELSCCAPPKKGGE